MTIHTIQQVNSVPSGWAILLIKDGVVQGTYRIEEPR